MLLQAAPPETYTLPPDKLAKAVEYAAARHQLHFFAAAWSVAILLLLLALRVSPRLRDFAERRTGRRIAQAYIFAPLFIFIVDLFDLPLAAWGHHLALKYDQSIQGWGSWLLDALKGEALSLALAGVLVWILYAAMHRYPRTWWLHFWVALVPIIVFLVFVTPMFIEPLFFKFTPLAEKHPALVEELGKVVARGGLDIPPARMFEMQASEKLKSVNAYVTGVGASKRVVVWDNTIEKLTTPETMFVFGHEMGHYVLHHIWKGIALTAVVVLLFLWIGYHTLQWALARWGERWGIREPSDWASLPVLLLALAIFGFLSEPVTNGISRVFEHNADVYGLEVTHGLFPDAPKVAAHAFQVLGEISLDDPNPSEFIQFWLYNHPSVASRLVFAAAYDPWGRGEKRTFIQ